LFIIDKVEMDWRLFLLSKCVRSFNLNQKKKKGQGEGEGKRAKHWGDGRDRVIGSPQHEAGELRLLLSSFCGGRNAS